MLRLKSRGSERQGDGSGEKGVVVMTEHPIKQHEEGSRNMRMVGSMNYRPQKLKRFL